MTELQTGEHFTSSFREVEAIREGWNIFFYEEGDQIQYQVCRLDTPSDWVEEAGFEPPYLKSDTEAWRIVMNGQGEHHAKAREFIKRHNPEEWEQMKSYDRLALA